MTKEFAENNVNHVQKDGLQLGTNFSYKEVNSGCADHGKITSRIFKLEICCLDCLKGKKFKVFAGNHAPNEYDFDTENEFVIIQYPKEKLVSEAITYLQMIQSSIDRMATSSAIFKGFAATIVAGISAISFSDTNKWILLLSFVPVLCFLILDIYYLCLERQFRFLFDMVRMGKKEVDYDLHPPKAKEIIEMDENANVRISACVKSPSILWFYIPMLLICMVVTIIDLFGNCHSRTVACNQ